MAQLTPFIVLFTDMTFTVPEAAFFMADDSDHAEEQMLDENADATVAWIVETDDVDVAFADYHRGSTAEEIATG
tara:strand:- start:9459 stop:9680 length:222 start_codon:yes stop_codon:yes gene_type:complete